MAVQQARDIGIEVQAPARTCEDAHCPFHGNLPVRGITVDGRVRSKKMERSVVVSREFTRPVPKYERLEKRTRRITAHLPPCMDVEVGDEVKIMECRPLSKTISFVVVEARKGRLEVTGVDYTQEGQVHPAVARAAEAEAEETEEAETAEEEAPESEEGEAA